MRNGDLFALRAITYMDASAGNAAAACSDLLSLNSETRAPSGKKIAAFDPSALMRRRSRPRHRSRLNHRNRGGTR